MATMRQGRHRGALSLHKLYAGGVVALLAGAAAAPAPAAATTTVAAASTVTAAMTAAAVQPGCTTAPAPADPIPEVPWTQDWFAPERVWALSRGRAVVVAVIDTGVDADHPQLRGRVLPGTDLLPEPAGAHLDCDSHGTAVASLIAAAPAGGIGFAGLAPGAEILPVRVAERGTGTSGPDQEPPVEPGTFAGAIRWATDQGAQVINVSIVFYQDHPVIADAVGYAVARDVIVVAAVGTPHETEGAPPTPYPAAYPGVVGVGAIAADGSRSARSYAGPHVDLVAPGEAVTAAAALGGHHQWTGTSFAAPFVSATAALVLAAGPGLGAADVIRRLLATADPGPGSPAESGHGVVNPYRALTERLTVAEPVAAEPPPPPAVDPVAQARGQRWQHTTTLAILITTSALALGMLAIGGGAVWRRGRARGWRPLRRATVAPHPTPDTAPERVFFTVPGPRVRR